MAHHSKCRSSDKVVTRLQKANLQTEKAVVEGRAAERVMEFVRNQNASLIVLSNHGRSGLRRPVSRNDRTCTQAQNHGNMVSTTHHHILEEQSKMSNEQVIAATPPITGKPWSIDADAPLQSVLDSPECPSLLRQMLTGTLSWQTRNETPVRRALTSVRIAPQWTAALLVLGATVAMEGDDGPTEISLETLVQRKPGGKVSTLHVRTGEMAWGEARVARTPADEPIVAAVAAVETDNGVVRQARVALTGAWSEPVGLAEAAAQLVGKPMDEKHIQAVANAVEKEVTPKGSFRGSEEYRRAMAGVLTRRALEACWRREAGDE